MADSLECVPNVSEGRRPEVVARLAAAAASDPGARVLDVSSDFDHDRTVLTLAGEPDALVRSLLAVYRVAIAEIDLSPPAGPVATDARGGPSPGVHPRVGAVDVVPFVPLGETPMAAAVAAAEALGREVAERFGLPVFLYEEAARRPERRNLAAVRRGGLAGLGLRLGDPAWAPDFGPPRLHPTAGATVIGARGVLVAFNAVLATADLAAAREIARAIRESSGGLPALKAIGVALASRGRAQVSMNLVDFRRTSPAAALAAVRREAAARGIEVEECELVGLIPEAALPPTPAEAPAEALLLPGFGPHKILEHRLWEEGM